MKLERWIALFFFSFLTCNMAFAVTPSRIREGKVEFAICTVGGQWAFDQGEKDGILLDDPSAQVIALTPTAFELQVAQSGLKFENYSDFEDCVNKEDHLDDKILDVKSSEYKKKKSLIDALKVENNKR